MPILQKCLQQEFKIQIIPDIGNDYPGKIFKLNEHTERLYNSAKLLGFKIPYSKKKINSVSKLLIKKQRKFLNKKITGIFI